MFEIALPVSIYLVNSIAGGIYVKKFFRGKYPEKITLFAWISLYFISQCFVLESMSGIYLFNGLVKVLADISVVLLLQILLYNKDLLKQLFVTVSFVAGKEIIKYIIVVLNNSHYRIFSKILTILLNKITTVEEVEMWNRIFNVSAWFAVIVPYTLLMILYLSVISRKFIRKDYQFQTHEYAFLIFPGVSALCISITLKMMMLSVENGIATTIFEKVPETMFWVPLICILLLGGVIVSVILFQKLIQLSEEERKRAVLENQIMQMQREIEEIQDIYADMKGLRHDMRSHLESIAAVVRRTSGKDREELDAYIGKMETTVSRFDFAYRTGNPITDVIIHRTKQEAEKHNISFEADFIYPDKQQIDVYDIGILLNNALENAVEASCRAEGKKSIDLRSYMKGNLFFIEVENDFSGELIIDKRTGLPVSSKDDKRMHGIGMENIQRCARKYKGDIDITISEIGDKKRFNLTIMMYEKNFTPEIS